MSRLKSGLLACCASLAAGPAGHAADFPRGDSGLIRPQRSGPPFSMAFEPGGRIDVEEATQA